MEAPNESPSEVDQDALEQALSHRDFGTAASICEAALERGSPGAVEAYRLWRTLAECQAGAGRSDRSAAAYEKAIALASASERPELQVARVDQLLRGGQIGPALAHGVEALGQLGMSVPRSTGGALLSLVFRRALVALRGLGWRRRSADDVPGEVLRRLDLLQALALGLGVIDHVRGADFNARYLLRALRVGEPTRVGIAMMQEGAFRSAQGQCRRGSELVEEGVALLEQGGDPAHVPLYATCRGICHYYSCHFSTSARVLADAEASFTADHRGGLRRELTIVRQLLLFALMHHGDLVQLGRRIRAYTVEGERRGDLFALGALRGRAVIAYLAEDALAEAERNVALTLQGWPERPFYAQHWCAMAGKADVALYRGDFDGAARGLERDRKGLGSSMLLRIPLVHIEYAHLRGRVALGRLAAGTGGREARSETAAAARRCEAYRIDFGLALGKLLRAGLARCAGDDATAVGLLAEAQIYFESTGALIWSTAAMHARSLLVGGDEGASQAADAAQRYQRHGVKSPARMTAALAPGLAPR